VHRLIAAASLALLMAPVFGTAPIRAFDCDPGEGYQVCKDLNDAYNKQQNLDDRIEALKRSIDDSRAKMAALIPIIQQLTAQITAKQAEIDKTQAEVDELDRQIRVLEADIARREAHLQVRQGLLDQRVRAMDKHGSVNYAQLVVTSTSFTQLVDRLMIVTQIVEADHKMLDDLKDERAQLDRIRAEVGVKRQERADVLRKLQGQKADLDKTKKTYDDAFGYYQALAAQQAAQQAELERQKREIDKQVEDLERKYAEIGGGTGIFRWPMMPHPMTQGYGCSSVGGIYWASCPFPHYLHTGIDLANARGWPVLAADSGIAAVYDTCCGYGKYIIIIHGHGFATLYAHMDGFVVGTGQAVAKGQQIGYEGSTGWSTGPHLHFEIRKNGGYENPCNYLICLAGGRDCGPGWSGRGGCWSCLWSSRWEPGRAPTPTRPTRSTSPVSGSAPTAASTPPPRKRRCEC
jgi:murein DD-endopeptidase MepM/ murein hydrolase activator NlpD